MLDNKVEILIVYLPFRYIDLCKDLIRIAVVDGQGDVVARNCIYIDGLLAAILKLCLYLIAFPLSKITGCRTHPQFVGAQHCCGILFRIDDRDICLNAQSLRIQGLNGDLIQLIADDLPALYKILDRIFRIKDIRIDQFLDNGAI